MTGEASVLSLYERWLQTGSPASEKRLRGAGILLAGAPRRVH